MPEDKALWRGPAAVTLAATIDQPAQIVQHARQLKPTELAKVAKAFESEQFDMALEFVWRRTMVFLKEQLSRLGMRFVGEMLGRNDIDEHSSPQEVLTDYEAIRLAQELGVVNRTGAVRLRQAAELLAHFGSLDAEGDLSRPEAVSALRACVEYVLASADLGVAMDFANFRARLENSTLRPSDPTLEALAGSPYLFLRTTIRVLLLLARTATGAQLENAVANLNTILPRIWPKLGESDRWEIGRTYVEVTAAGKSAASAGAKGALLKVKGFDYVPENVRSETYRAAAASIIKAHEGLNNFYNEPEPVARLAQLGSGIPSPAIAECMQAVLCVVLGNHWGHSFAAQDHAKEVLRSVTDDRWRYYLDRCLPTDDRVLYKLMDEKPAERFVALVEDYNLSGLKVAEPRIARLVNLASSKAIAGIMSAAAKLHQKLGY